MPEQLRVGLVALSASCGLLLASAASGAEPPAKVRASGSSPPATASSEAEASPESAKALLSPAPASQAGIDAVSAAPSELEPDRVLLARLEAVPRTERTLNQWLSLARAYVRQRKLLEASDAYEQLRRSGAGQLIASEHLQAERILPRVSIRVVGPREGDARVFVDSHPLPQPGDSSGHPVNPGWHTFVVEVDGRATAAERIYVEEGARELVELSTSAGSLSLAAGTARRSGTPSGAALPHDDAKEADSWVPTYVSLGVATAASVATAVFAVQATEAMSRAGSSCDVSTEQPDVRFCGTAAQQADALRQHDEFETLANATTVSGLIAVAGLGSALTFWLLHDDGQSSTELALSPRGVQLSGNF